MVTSITSLILKISFFQVLNYNYIYLINLWILLCPEWLCFDWSMGCIPLIKSLNPTSDFRIAVVFFFWLTLCATVFAINRVHGLTQRYGYMFPFPFHLKSLNIFFISRTLTFGLLSMFILFLPASNIFFKVGFVVAERVLYLPSFGYFLVVVVGVRKLATFTSYRKVGVLLKFFNNN